jgi:hypothetical protein
MVCRATRAQGSKAAVDNDGRKKYSDKTVLLLYGGPNEHHEIAIEVDGEEEISTLQGVDVQTQRHDDGYTIIAWDISDDVEDRKVVRVQSDFYIYLLSEPTDPDSASALANRDHQIEMRLTIFGCRRRASRVTTVPPTSSSKPDTW